MGRIEFFVKKDGIELFGEGDKGVDILIPGEGIIEGKPFIGAINLNIYEFMDLLFSFYFDREYTIRKENLELKKGKSKDIFLKLTDYSKRQRSMFYIKDLRKFLEKVEKTKGEIQTLRFRHLNLHVEYDRETLNLTTESVDERIYPQRIEEIIEIVRFGLYGGWDFITYGVGKVSILKPDGYLRVGDRIFTEKTRFLNGKEVPEALIKVYLCVR